MGQEKVRQPLPLVKGSAKLPWGYMISTSFSMGVEIESRWKDYVRSLHLY